MKDYKVIKRDEAFSLAIAGKTVKAIDFDEEALYEISDMQIFAFAELYKKPNVLFAVKGKYGLEKN